LLTPVGHTAGQIAATISEAATAEKPWLAARRALAWRVNKPENDDASIVEPIELATNTA